MSPVVPEPVAESPVTLLGERPRELRSVGSSSYPDVSPTDSPAPTLVHNIIRQDFYYRTLSVTLPYTTYTTTILLGDSFPTTLQPTTYAVPTTPSVKVQTPGIATGAIVGIVVGLVVGFLIFFGVLYIYLLRARQEKRRRRRRRSRRGSSATAEGAPPPPPGPGPGPGPPPAP